MNFSIQRALISVYDKTGLLDLAQFLQAQNVEILSTGNTATYLKSCNIRVTLVSDYTGFPEIMDGRVKTLHPKIHGGILGRRDHDAAAMAAHHIPPIDLVVVNLYPFQAVTQNPACTLAQAIENIDIGGPTLIRAAAKNHAWCTLLTDQKDYAFFIESWKKENGQIPAAFRLSLAAQAFALTAQYDQAITTFLSAQSAPAMVFPEHLQLNYHLKETLRYGENPHQSAAFYAADIVCEDSITQATFKQGKALSFNNVVDADTALECVKSFKQPACVIVKHANPCGVATGTTVQEAYNKAYACDPMSAFGGIIAFNHEVDETLMQTILKQQFVEVLIAPGFSEKALQCVLAKPLCRVLTYHPQSRSEDNPMHIQCIKGGILYQTCDPYHQLPQYEVVTKHQPSPSQIEDLLFAWQVVKFVKSNAIVYAKGGQTLGIGAGQSSRIFSAHIASLKALEQQLSLKNATMASDAFFPFSDSIELAHKHGINAIIQPGGSKKDNEVIHCADTLGMVMLFTKERHFRH